MFGMSDPGAHTRINFLKFDRASSPLVAEPAQAVAETPYIVLW